MSIYIKAMFANHNISTLAIIEMHIRDLEYAFMVVSSSQALLIELGNAYKVKMKLIKMFDHDNFNKKSNTKKRHYPSKINSETKPREIRSKQSFYECNRQVPELSYRAG